MTAVATPKGQGTRRAVINKALDLASTLGLEGLTIGVLAKKAGLSKSGLYAHFKSKEDLQLAVLDRAAERFVEDVISPAIAQPRGLPRIERLFELWIKWDTGELSGGCPWVAAAADFDDRPGPVRDVLVFHINHILSVVARAASISVDEGHLAADLDTKQFAYEYWGIVLAHHHTHRLLGAPDANALATTALANLIERSRG